MLAIFVFLATKSREELPPQILLNEIVTMFSPTVFERLTEIYWSSSAIEVFNRMIWKAKRHKLKPKSCWAITFDYGVPFIFLTRWKR